MCVVWFLIGFLFMHIIKLRHLIYFSIIFAVLIWFGKFSLKKKTITVLFFESVPQYRCKIPHRTRKALCMCINTCMLIHTRTYNLPLESNCWNDKVQKSQDCAGDDPNSLAWLCNLHTKPCWLWPKENLRIVTIQLKSSGKLTWPFSASLLCCLPKSD